MFSTKDYLYLENKLKERFNEHFTLIAGKEFFEGEEDLIVSTFFEVISVYINKRVPRKEHVCKCKTTPNTYDSWNEKFAFKIEK